MREIVREYKTWHKWGKPLKRIRRLKESGDILEGVYRILKWTTVLNTDSEWRYVLEEGKSDDIDETWIRITALPVAGEAEAPFYYDFQVPDPDTDGIKDRLIEAIEVITDQILEKEEVNW